MADKALIGLDYSHNNKLTLEASSYADFTHFLFSSGYKLGKIQAGFESLAKIDNYNMILLSTPNGKEITEDEIEVLDEYVKKGGNLMIISTRGGDHTNRTNLNSLTSKFGFEFVEDEVNDSMNYVNLQKRPLLMKFIPHTVTEQIKKVVYSSSCSLKILDFVEDDIDIKIETLILSGLNCWRKLYVPKEKKWVDEDSPKIPLMVAVEYYEGKVIGFGNLSMFSSLGSEYGFSAFDNDILIANMLRWLTMDAVSEGKVVTVNLNLDLFYWASSIVKEENWENMSDFINVSLKSFKDNYKEIIKNIKRTRAEKKIKKAYHKAKKDKESSEEKILEMIPERKREDLEDIMSALEAVTGEKYELELEDIENQDIIEFDDDSVEEKQLEDMTVKELKKIGENEEITLPPKADKSEIVQIIKDVEEENERIKEKLHDELEQSKEELEENLEKEMEKELEIIMEHAKEEIEEQINTEIEPEKAKKIGQEIEKSLGKDIRKIKGWIMSHAKDEMEKEIIKTSKEHKDIDRSKIIQSVVEHAKEKMEEDRAKRIKAIKEKEIEIIKENQEFMDDIMSAADLFDAPDLDEKKKD